VRYLKGQATMALEPNDTAASGPLDLVRLAPLMAQTSGDRAVVIGLIDGPVAAAHPELASENVKDIGGRPCVAADSVACRHGTFVAGMLLGRRGASAPAICPGCLLLVRPIFDEHAAGTAATPSTTPEQLAQAILDCIAAGARVLNLSSALMRPSVRTERKIEEALDLARRRNTLVVAAAGNQGNLGGSAITRHPWVIPVTACDRHGLPLDFSNFGHSIGRHGLSAPGTEVASLAPEGPSVVGGGTSVAAPFVTGAAALLWSQFPDASAPEIRRALTSASTTRRGTLVPPLLNAWAAHNQLRALHQMEVQP
jgi:subtilisin family serine protease